MRFPCTKCGACCRRTHSIPGFPFRRRPDGACEHLKADNTCAIYETRPMICRVGHSFPFARQMWGWSPKRYLRETAAQCNRWMDEDGLPADKRVQMPD